MYRFPLTITYYVNIKVQFINGYLIIKAEIFIFQLIATKSLNTTTAVILAMVINYMYYNIDENIVVPTTNDMKVIQSIRSSEHTETFCESASLLGSILYFFAGCCGEYDSGGCLRLREASLSTNLWRYPAICCLSSMTSFSYLTSFPSFCKHW